MRLKTTIRLSAIIAIIILFDSCLKVYDPSERTNEGAGTVSFYFNNSHVWWRMHNYWERFYDHLAFYNELKDSVIISSLLTVTKDDYWYPLWDMNVYGIGDDLTEAISINREINAAIEIRIPVSNISEGNSLSIGKEDVLIRFTWIGWVPNDEGQNIWSARILDLTPEKGSIIIREMNNKTVKENIRDKYYEGKSLSGDFAFTGKLSEDSETTLWEITSGTFDTMVYEEDFTHSHH